MYTVKAIDFPVISGWILSKPESPDMSFHHPSLDGIVSLDDIEDKSDVVASKFEQIAEQVCQSVGSLDSDIIEVGGSIPE